MEKSTRYSESRTHIDINYRRLQIIAINAVHIIRYAFCIVIYVKSFVDEHDANTKTGWHYISIE